MIITKKWQISLIILRIYQSWQNLRNIVNSSLFSFLKWLILLSGFLILYFVFPLTVDSADSVVTLISCLIISGTDSPRLSWKSHIKWLFSFHFYLCGIFRWLPIISWVHATVFASLQQDIVLQLTKDCFVSFISTLAINAAIRADYVRTDEALNICISV